MIYFVTDGQFVKVGTALSVDKRLSSLTSGNPRKLSLCATCEGGRLLEKRIHRALPGRRHTSEWFAKSPELIEVIEAAKAGRDIEEIILPLEQRRVVRRAERKRQRKGLEREFRAAVALLAQQIRSEYGLTDKQIAKRLGVSESTIANARNKRGNLDAVTMLNLAALFGGTPRLRPILALVNGSPADDPTPAERLDHALREIELVRKGLA